MTTVRRIRADRIFRYLVAPSLILCAVFRHPVFQWIAVMTAAIWILAGLMPAAWDFFLHSRQEKATEPFGSDDLEPEEISSGIRVKDWYLENGESVMAQMMDELNTQGYRTLLMNDQGEMFVKSGGISHVVCRISGFPSRMEWEELCGLLREDEIIADIRPEGLKLSW